MKPLKHCLFSTASAILIALTLSLPHVAWAQENSDDGPSIEPNKSADAISAGKTEPKPDNTIFPDSSSGDDAINAPSAKSQIYIKVGEAKAKKSLLALTSFQFSGSTSANSNYREIGAELYNTVMNDLDVSAYFDFINQKAYLEDTGKVGLKPAPGDPKGFSFAKWTPIGTDFLIRAGYHFDHGQIIFETYVYSVPQAKLVIGKEYQAAAKDARRVAHTFSNDLIKAITGVNGFFLTQVVMSSDRGGHGWKEIYIMDWDAKNMVKVSNHRSISISPNWSPDAKTIVYTSYAYHPALKMRNADLFSYELATGKRFTLSTRLGINSGASYSPDGSHIFMTISQSGNPDIFKVDTEGENLARITNGPHGAMNVEPAVSPDGKKIAFSSDRSGRPMIYVMNLDGTNLNRMTFAGKYNASPIWSSDGKRIAFAGWDKSHFDIFIMNADGSNLARLTSASKKNGKASNNEDPSFSPDGRIVMFTSDRTGAKQVYVVNSDGNNERRITTDSSNYFRPKWSGVNR